MNIQIIGIRENPSYLEQGIEYFAQRWPVDRRLYDDCIRHSITTNSSLPRWYLMLKDGRIIGSYGLLTNDFISREDLMPWLCALYIEEDQRGQALGSVLLEHGRKQAASLGFSKLYLCTDHIDYYEKYGWRHIANGYHPSGKEAKIYENSVIKDTKTLLFGGGPRLETKRLLLRRLTDDDAADVYNYAKNGEVARYMPWDAHQSLEDAKTFIRMAQQQLDLDQTCDLGIEYKPTGRIIGSIGITSIDKYNRCGMVGYALSQNYWGQGLTTEALHRLIRYMFEELRLNRIEAYHIIQNKSSGRVMQKAGMKYEGVLQKKLFIKGDYCDVKLYAILRDEWFYERQN